MAAERIAGEGRVSAQEDGAGEDEGKSAGGGTGRPHTANTTAMPIAKAAARSSMTAGSDDPRAPSSSEREQFGRTRYSRVYEPVHS
jgi:hypothetical protein